MHESPVLFRPANFLRTTLLIFNIFCSRNLQIGLNVLKIFARRQEGQDFCFIICLVSVKLHRKDHRPPRISHYKLPSLNQWLGHVITMVNKHFFFWHYFGHFFPSIMLFERLRNNKFYTWTFFKNCMKYKC